MTDEHPEVIPTVNDGVPADDNAEPEDAEVGHDDGTFEWDPEQFLEEPVDPTDHPGGEA